MKRKNAARHKICIGFGKQIINNNKKQLEIETIITAKKKCCKSVEFYF